MQGDIETSEKAYSTSEIASMLDMGVTTVRKYAQHLEKAGHKFFKNKNNARLFVEKDILTIRYLKELREKTNITVEQATKLVMEKVGNGGDSQDAAARSTSPAIVKPQENKSTITQEQYEEIKELIQNQNELINTLIERLDQQQEAINEWLNERDKELMRTITERLETQKQIAAAEDEEKSKEKKSFFRWLFAR
ncbi:MerR family transcriptional regulator [Oceanobacillus halophilus]|nr:MerR family transcriptional regulator [Oceanobacillus halophilus]